jgi:hypothetical protein
LQLPVGEGANLDGSRNRTAEQIQTSVAEQSRQSHAERTMRTFLLALRTAAVAFAVGNQVAARDYPFCIQGDDFGGGPGDCIFSNHQ